MNKVYPKPSITADVIVHDVFNKRILLIKRKHEPYEGCYAIPGGFFNPEDFEGTLADYSILSAAFRELREEVGLDATFQLKHSMNFVTVQDFIGRDPRGRVVTLIYALEIFEDPEGLLLKAGDDASEISWHDVDDIMNGKIKLAFDHFDSISRYIRKIKYV